MYIGLLRTRWGQRYLRDPPGLGPSPLRFEAVPRLWRGRLLLPRGLQVSIFKIYYNFIRPHFTRKVFGQNVEPTFIRKNGRIFMHHLRIQLFYPMVPKNNYKSNYFIQMHQKTITNPIILSNGTKKLNANFYAFFRTRLCFACKFSQILFIKLTPGSPRNRAKTSWTTRAGNTHTGKHLLSVNTSEASF
jgi:hypothetical protein